MVCTLTRRSCCGGYERSDAVGNAAFMCSTEGRHAVRFAVAGQECGLCKVLAAALPRRRWRRIAGPVERTGTGRTASLCAFERQRGPGPHGQAQRRRARQRLQSRPHARKTHPSISAGHHPSGETDEPYLCQGVRHA